MNPIPALRPIATTGLLRQLLAALVLTETGDWRLGQENTSLLDRAAAAVQQEGLELAADLARDAILAGLNLLHRELQAGKLSADCPILLILTNCGAHRPITLAEISELAEEINVA